MSKNVFKNFFFNFFICTFLLFFCFLFLINKILDNNYFTSQYTDSLRSNLIDLPAEDICKIKLNQAYTSQTYDVAIFGNSRSLYISKDNIDLGNQSFFNFSIPGQSFRNSIAIITELSKRKKLPKKIIVSYDFFEFGLPGDNQICFISFSDRIVNILGDFKFLLKKKLYYDGTIYIYNNFINEFKNFKYKISIIRIRTILKLFFLYPNKNSLLVYDDGSIQERIINDKKEYKFKFQREDKYQLIEKDFKHLSNLIKNKSELIIYVSPLEPSVFLDKNFKLSDNAKINKYRFLMLCKKFSFSCFNGLIIKNTDEPFWADSTHPPAKRMGEWISKVLKNAI